MVFENVPRSYNLLSSLFTWILLAGFVVLPGTFNTIEGNIHSGSSVGQTALRELQHLPLYVHIGSYGFTLLALLLMVIQSTE